MNWIISSQMYLCYQTSAVSRLKYVSYQIRVNELNNQQSNIHVYLLSTVIQQSEGKTKSLINYIYMNSVISSQIYLCYQQSFNIQQENNKIFHCYTIFMYAYTFQIISPRMSIYLQLLYLFAA
jgi:hypothetical protein